VKSESTVDFLLVILQPCADKSPTTLEPELTGYTFYLSLINSNLISNFTICIHTERHHEGRIRISSPPTHEERDYRQHPLQ